MLWVLFRDVVAICERCAGHVLAMSWQRSGGDSLVLLKSRSVSNLIVRIICQLVFRHAVENRIVHVESSHVKRFPSNTSMDRKLRNTESRSTEDKAAVLKHSITPSSMTHLG